MAGPLRGITVLDFSWGMPGAITSLVLADFGAEVIKVEPPQGDPFRSHPGWLAWNRGKKGIVLDLKSQAGKDNARQLVERADVLIESFRPGETRTLGIDYATLSRANPRLVYCSISGWGQKGHLSQLKSYEGLVAAKAGRMLGLAEQTHRGGPVYHAVQMASWAASQAAVWGILGTLTAREKLGQGDWVQTSLLHGFLPYDNDTIITRQLVERGLSRGRGGGGAARPQSSAYRTKDGRWIQFANNNFRLFQSFIRALGLWHIFNDERFKDPAEMTAEDLGVLSDMVMDRILEKTLDEWMELLVEDGDVGAEPYLPTLEGMKHPQYVHNNHAAEIEDPRVGKMTVLGPLVVLSDTPGEVGAPAPDLGQHTTEVLQENGEAQRAKIENEAPAAHHSSPFPLHSSKPRPLDGVTILDFATVIAGPYASAHLADLGARVIKVEPPEGDALRVMSRDVAGGPVKVNAGKESIQLDLKTNEGIEILHKLISMADGLIHNYRPGVPERLYMDYQTCHKLNPRLVYVYAGAYGLTGPHSKRPAFHAIPGAVMGGALNQAGKGMPPSPETPLSKDEMREVSRWMGRANETSPDRNASMGIATGMMLGLYARERTGQGQSVISTMLQTNAYANADEAFDYAGRPPRPEPDAECYGISALQRLYRAQEGWVFLACLFDEEWESFARTAGRSDLLSDPRFRTATDRVANDDALIAEIEKVFATAPAAEWENRLTAADVACVQADGATMGDFFLDDPQARDNGLTVPAETGHVRFGDYIRHGAMVQFERQGNRYGPGILGGQHTRPILAELGYSEDQIEALFAQGVVSAEEIEPAVAR